MYGSRRLEKCLGRGSAAVILTKAKSIGKFSLPCVVFNFSLLVAAQRLSGASASQVKSSEESLEKYSSEERGGGGMAQNNDLLHVDFEVYGTVQGVFFRKYTQAEGQKLGLRGFCRNTSAGTVSGSMEGPNGSIDKMKQWLQNTGSPMSQISKAVFTNMEKINEYSLPPGFEIKRTI